MLPAGMHVSAGAEVKLQLYCSHCCDAEDVQPDEEVIQSVSKCESAENKYDPSRTRAGTAAGAEPRTETATQDYSVMLDSSKAP